MDKETKSKNFIQAGKFSNVSQVVDDLVAINDGDEFEKSIMKLTVQL